MAGNCLKADFFGAGLWGKKGLEAVTPAPCWGVQGVIFFVRPLKPNAVVPGAQLAARPSEQKRTS
jgi:hypothetical protein